MNQSFKAFVNEITVDSKCSLNELLTEFYKAAGKHISFSEITEQEKIDFRKMTEEMDIHESFVGHFLENFNESITPLGLFEVVKHIASIADTTDVRIALEKLFRHPEATEHMKDYVKVWLMQPLQVFDKITEFLSEMLFDDELILNTALNDKKLFIKATKKALIHPEDFNLVSFIVYNENDIPSRIHSRTEESLALEIAGVESVKDVRERIVTIKMDDVKGPETGLDGLRNATDCLLKIHQAYPTMQANMINYSTRSINSSMMGGARLSPAQVVRLYAGDYSNYEQTSPNEGGEGDATINDAAHSAVRGLITNPEAFDALPPAGRRLVAQHLPATRKQFNQIVVNAINSVHTWMPQLLNAHTENRELNRVIDGLAKSYNSLTGNQQGMVDWFMHKFAPAVNAYRARALPSTGIAVVDNVFGGSPLKTATRIYGSGMSGGVRTVYVNHNESTEAPRFYGGGPIADYYEGVKRTQLRFNDQFDSLYRKLTAAVRMVADKAQFTVEQGINRVIEALMSITIASKKTVMKISGLKPKEDLNVRYTAMVEHVIKTIENTKISGFGEVISVLRSLVSLLKSTHQEARSLIKKVSESTKSSEEIVRFIDFKHEEMPSKLTAQELHALVESINALVYAKRGHQLTAKIERHRDEEVKEYIRKVTSRTEAINGHYENQLDKWLKYNTHTHVDTKTLIKSHIKSVQAAMVYLNEKVDTKLMQWRQKMARGGNITKKQIEDIERLTMTYMHYRPGEKILQIFAKLENLRKEVTDDLSIGDIYKVTGVIQKIVMNAGYVEMIQQLYKTLEIDDGSFDWNLFKINITKLLVDKMLVVTGNIFAVSCGEKLDTTSKLLESGGEVFLRDTPAYYRVANCLTKALEDTIKLPYRQLFNLVLAFMSPNKETGAATAIHHALNLRATDALYAGYLCNTVEQVTKEAAGRLTGERKLVPVETWEIAKDIASGADDTAYKKWTKEIADRIGIEAFSDDAGFTFAEIKIEGNTPDTNLTHLYDRFSVLILDHMTQIMQKNKVYGIYTKDNMVAFAKAVRSAFIVERVAAGSIADVKDPTKVKDAYPILKLSKQDVSITWDGFFGLSNETPIIVDIFHSMIANVIYVFNRYIALRYTGNDINLPVPMMTSAMLGGNTEDFGVGSSMEGTKMEAGSAIDVIGTHDLNFDRVIPEAVPFYAIAVDLFNTFMKEFWRGIDNDVTPKTKFGDNVFRMYVNVSDFSILHNLHEIFKDYTIIDNKHYETAEHKADLTMLSEVQLKMIVAELNKVWNLVSGSGKEKLMNAIDYLISEINSSILFTTKSRYEMLKRDGHLDLDVSSKLEQQFSGVLDTLKETITANLNTVTAMNPNAMAEFETWLTASTERIAKETNETARINYLRGIINGQDTDKYKNPFEDYYKFCEFVMTPIMITATGYKEAFKLFDNLRSNGAAKAKSSIDLNKYKVALMKKGVSVIDGSLTNEGDYIDATAATNFVDVKTICEEAHKADFTDDSFRAAAASLVNSPVVAHYNTLLIRRELKRAIAANKPFEMPKLWLPLIPSTYPTEMKLEIDSGSYVADDRINANIVAMRELYPHIKSDRPIDFFNALLADFSADFDHLLHTFMTYPGISDRFLMKLKDIHKDSATSLKKLIQETLIDGGKYMPNVLNSATIAKTTHPFVPLYPEDLNMQPYIGATNVPAISLQKYGDVKSSEYTMIGTGQKVYSIIFSTKESIATSGKQLCQYGPLDWVVYRLAACNTTGYTLPVMLYEMLKTNSLFGKYLIECIVEGTNVVYTPHSTGYVYNVVTQNILTRSSTDRNRQESAEFKTMNKSWLANLVSTIPGLVSYIKALSVSTESSVKDYNGVSIEQLYVTLSSILESFYEECMTYMPFVPFMSDFIPGTFYASIERKMTKYHPIAEIYASMLNENCECDGLKFEWANRAYYSGTLQISFPEYKNRDKYEDLKKWGGDLFQNSLFSQEFNGTMDIIARAIVRHRIIRRNANLKTAEDRNPSNEDLINTCLLTAKRCYELDPKVTSIFINNILNFSKSSVRGMLGGGIYSTDALNTKVSTTVSTSIIKLLNGIFDGLNGIIEANNRFPVDPSLDELITAAISLLYDNPNVRAYYTFKDGADEYKKIDNLMRGNEVDILGALGGAADGMPDDYTARGKQLLAFSAVNIKSDKKIEGDAKIYGFDGTIGTSARYVTRNASSDLTVNRFRELIKPAYCRPTDLLGTETAAIKAPTSDLSKLVGKLIYGYANSSRLAIASNAMATLTRAVFEIADIATVINAVSGNENDRKCLYELFNWLSLADDNKMLRPKGAAAGAGVAVPADYVDVAGYVKNIGDVTGATHKRFDGVPGDYTLKLDALNTAGTIGDLFTGDNKANLAKVLHAIAEIDESVRTDGDALKKAIKVVTDGANAEANATGATAYSDTNEAVTTVLFGKTIAVTGGRGMGDATHLSSTDATAALKDGTILLGWLLSNKERNNATEAETKANLGVSNASIAALNRLVLTYYLCSRWPDQLAAWFKDGTNATDCILTDFLKCLGYQNNYNTIDADKLSAAFKLLATVIEIGCKAPLAFTGSKTGMITLVNALGANIITNAHAAYAIANFTFPADALGNPVGATRATRVANASKLGASAMLLFDIFFGGTDNRPKLAKFVTALGNADPVENNKNAVVWSYILTGGYFNGITFDAADENRIATNHATRYTFGLEKASFAPLDNTFKSLEIDKTNFFGEEIEVVEGADVRDAAKRGVGREPAKLLDALTAGDGLLEPEVNNDSLAESLYSGVKYSEFKASEHINDFRNKAGVIASLRALGFLSLVCSADFSIPKVKLEGGGKLVNMLAASFGFQQNAFIPNNGCNLQVFDHKLEDICNGFANFLINQIQCPGALIKMTDFIKNATELKNLMKNNRMNALNAAAVIIAENIESGFIMGDIKDTFQLAGNQTIGVQYRHPEAAIHLSKLPRIVPTITAYQILDKRSVRLYQFFPRSIGEYMLWNPMYELFNIRDGRKETPDMYAELINIPFNAIVEPSYTKNLKGGVDPDYWIANHNWALKFSFTPGLFSANIYNTGGAAVDSWVASFDNYRGEKNKIDYSAPIYKTDEPTLLIDIKDEPTVTKVNATALTNKLTEVITKWCDDFDTKADALRKDGNSLGWSLNMLGGSVFDIYINTDGISAGEPYKIYPNIYRTTDDATGLTFYGTLFKQLSRTTHPIGALALAYFNRSLLTFSGVLSNYVYPNAIYGKGLFDKFSSSLSEVIANVSDKVTGDVWKTKYSDSDVIKNRWDFYSSYIQYFAKKVKDTNIVINASDRALSPLNQCLTTTPHTTNKEVLDKAIVRNFDAMTIHNLATTTYKISEPTVKENYQNMLSAEYTAPSICNSFLTILHNLIIGKTNAKDPETSRDLSKMEWFIGTETMGVIRSVDSLLTYTAILSSLIKQLSFFDMDEDMERTYVTRDPAEPFMGIKPDDDRF